MLNCLTYIAFVYWAVLTVHTVLPIDVAVCGADPNRGGLGAFLHHTFGGHVDLDVSSWAGYPCRSNLLFKLLFILQRPTATVRHILSGGGQDEPFVPILFIVPLAFIAVVLVRQLLGFRLMSDTAARTMLKLGVAVGCRGVILLQSLSDPTKQSVYYKRYSKVEFFIVAWTAYIIELPVWHEALVSGGTLTTMLLMCCLFPHHMRPEVNPWNVALQGIAATAFGVLHASYQQRRRIQAERAARAAQTARAARASSKAAPATEDGDGDAATTTAAAAADKASGSGGSGGDGGGSGAGATAAAAAAAGTPAAAPGHTAAAAPSPSSPSGEGVAAAAAAAAAPATAPSLAAAAAIAAAAAAGQGRSGVVGVGARAPRLHYVSPARICRVSIKVGHAHLADLPRDLMRVVNDGVLAGSGWQAIGAYAREGCLELILDLRPVVPARPSPPPYNADGGAARTDDSRAQHDQDKTPAGAAAAADVDLDADGGGGGAAGDVFAAGAEAEAFLDDATVLELSRSVVSHLHSTGQIRPDLEPSVVLQLGSRTVMLTWQAETETWDLPSSDDGVASDCGGDGDRDGSDNGKKEHAGADPRFTLPSLELVTPRLAVWPGLDAPLRLTAAVRGPSAEEILVGGGLVVRHASCPLPYSVLEVTRQSPPPPLTSPLLLVQLAVSGVPSSGMLRVEARTSTGRLSGPVSVLVDFDTDLISGLEAILDEMDEQSAVDVLEDYGTWMDAAAAALRSLRESGGGGGGGCRMEKDVRPASGAAARCGNSSSGGGDGGGGGSSSRSRNNASAASCAVGKPSGALLAAVAGSLALMPYVPMPYLDPQHWIQFQHTALASGHSRGGDGAMSPPPPLPPSLPPQIPPSLQTSMLTTAADLLALCCKAGSSNPASAAVADRLLSMVALCDGRVPAAAVGALLAAVPAPPSGAGALHLAVAGGSTYVASVLLRWQELLYGTGAGGVGAEAADLWVSRATCGVTPLHVAAARADGGAVAAWALARYPAAACAWCTAASDDGMTPAAMAAHLGGRWRVRLWYGNPVVQAIRYALPLPLLVRRALELVWGFDDVVREGRYTATPSRQALDAGSVRSRCTAVAALLPLVVLLVKAASGSAGPRPDDDSHTSNGSIICCSEALALALALAFHVSASAPVPAWLCARAPFRRHHRRSHTVPKATNSVVAMAAACGASSKTNTTDTTTGQHLQEHSPRSGVSGGCGIPRGGEGLRRSLLLVMHLCRSAVKAAVGLSLWPFSLPPGAAVFLSRGGDIGLEAVVRPLLEQVALPARLLISLADAPAMYLLYRGAERRQPGAVVPHPLGRVALYQVVLLATTAAVSATNRVLFLRSEQARGAWLEASVCAALSNPTTGPGGRPKGAAATDGDAPGGNASATSGAGAAAASRDQCRTGACSAPNGSAAAVSGDVVISGSVVAGVGAGAGGGDGGSSGRCLGSGLWPRHRTALPSSSSVS